MGVGEQRDPFGRGAEQRRAGRRGRRGSPSAIARWVLPVPGGPSRTTFSLPCEEVELAEVQRPCRGGSSVWKAEVELLERLARREAGGLDAALAAVAVAAVDLGLEQRLGELLIAPLLLRGRARRAWATPSPRPAPSAPGTGARARSSGGSCDQRVIGGQRADLDDWLAARRGARGAGACSARACSSAVIVRCRANERACRQASSPVSSATARTSRWVTRTSTRRPTRRGSSE